ILPSYTLRLAETPRHVNAAATSPVVVETICDSPRLCVSAVQNPYFFAYLALFASWRFVPVLTFRAPCPILLLCVPLTTTPNGSPRRCSCRRPRLTSYKPAPGACRR